MAATARAGLSAACAFALWACSTHHTTSTPSAGSAAPAPEAGRPAAAGRDPGEAGREAAPAITPPGVRATALLVPVDPAKREAPDRLEGRATFSAQVASVDLALAVRGCYGLASFPVTIKEGRACDAATLKGASWDAPRGEGLPSFSCIGAASGSARAAHARSNEADKPWTIGGPRESDLLGHAMVIHDPATLEPIACGVIERAPDERFVPVAPGTGMQLEIQAQVAGICLSSAFTQDEARRCPEPAALVKCSNEHCNLGACLEECKDFTACLEAKGGDPCETAFECTPTDACIDCQNEAGYCSFSYCLAEVSCAPPAAPDGPCAQLTACCQMQGDEAASCLDLVRVIEQLSGDPSCRGVMNDWNVTAHLKVPCQFD